MGPKTGMGYNSGRGSNSELYGMHMYGLDDAAAVTTCLISASTGHHRVGGSEQKTI